MRNVNWWTVIATFTIFFGGWLFWVGDGEEMVRGGILILISGFSAGQIDNVREIGSKEDETR